MRLGAVQRDVIYTFTAVAVGVVPRAFQLELLAFIPDDATTLLVVVLKPTDLNSAVQVARRPLEGTQFPGADILSDTLKLDPVDFALPVASLNQHIVEFLSPLFKSVNVINLLQSHHLLHFLLQVSPSRIVKLNVFRCPEQTFTFDHDQSRCNRPVLLPHDKRDKVYQWLKQSCTVDVDKYNEFLVLLNKIVSQPLQLASFLDGVDLFKSNSGISLL